MTRVPIHDLESAPPGSLGPLSRQAKRVGRVLNIHGAMANSPALIGLYDVMETHLAENSSLDNATRQAIHLAVSAANECDYCQVAYGAQPGPRASTPPRSPRFATGTLRGGRT
jgi:alkylhydroperoxidase family enzyme